MGGILRSIWQLPTAAIQKWSKFKFSHAEQLNFSTHEKDIPRIWGSGQQVIDSARYDKKNQSFISYEEHITKLMSSKSEDRLASG